MVPARVTPKAALDDAGENIELGAANDGTDGSKAVSGGTMAESLAAVGETDMVQYRLTQQAILSDFGLEALRGHSLAELQQLATRLCADGMRARFCKLLRFLPDENALFVCAGVGWNPGVVGTARVGADIDSPAGYALRTGKPVISNHLGDEERFRTPTLMADHGVRRAINVLVLANGRPWGVLEVDSPEEGRFDVADIPFLQGFANLLGVAIERHRAEEGLREALAHQRLLVRESSHRAKNSLALVSSLLNLQVRGAASGDVRSALNEAVSRIMTVATAHDLLWQSKAAGEIDVGNLVEELCPQLQAQAPAITLTCRADGFVLGAERAIAVGLLITELVTNAAKHAYSGGTGDVFVTCAQQADTFTISVSDRGKGLPEGFDIRRSGDTSLGMRMIRSLAVQLGGTIDVRTAGGATFSLTAKLDPGS